MCFRRYVIIPLTFTNLTSLQFSLNWCWLYVTLVRHSDWLGTDIASTDYNYVSDTILLYLFQSFNFTVIEQSKLLFQQIIFHIFWTGIVSLVLYYYFIVVFMYWSQYKNLYHFYNDQCRRVIWSWATSFDQLKYSSIWCDSWKK